MSKPHENHDVLPPRRRSLSWGMTALGCFGTLALLVLLGALSIGLYFRGRNQRALAAVQAELNRIHAAGEPITIEEMDKFHRVPDGAFDATPLWLDAIRSAAATKSGNEAKLPIVGEGQLADLRAGAPQSLLPLAQQLLAAQAETIAKTRQAAAAGGQCRYPIDFSAGMNARLDHVQQARELARILSLRLHVAVETGDLAAAVESLEWELALAATLDHEPTFVSQLVRMAVIGIALRDLRRLVSEVPLSETQLESLQRRIAAIEVQSAVKDGLFGERALGLHTFHHLSQVEGMEVLAVEDGTLGRPGDLAAYLALMREMVEAADQPVGEARQMVERTEGKLMKQIGTSNPLDRMEILVTSQLMPATSKIFDSSARLQAQRDAAVCGIAFRRYQLEHDSPPKSLDALVPKLLPAVPSDPFAAGASPLSLAVDGEHFSVYSVGANGTDNKSLLRDPESQDDVGFVAKLAAPTAGSESTKPAAGSD